MIEIRLRSIINFKQNLQNKTGGGLLGSKIFLMGGYCGNNSFDISSDVVFYDFFDNMVGIATSTPSTPEPVGEYFTVVSTHGTSANFNFDVARLFVIGGIYRGNLADRVLNGSIVNSSIVIFPTATPTRQPTVPTVTPTKVPTMIPTAPTVMPTTTPTNHPTDFVPNYDNVSWMVEIVLISAMGVAIVSGCISWIITCYKRSQLRGNLNIFKCC